MAVSLSCQGIANALDVYDDVAATTPTLLAQFGNPVDDAAELTKLTERWNVETKEHELIAQFPYNATPRSSVSLNNVFRLGFPASCFKEFRIDSVNVIRGELGEQTVEAKGLSIHLDLVRRSGQVRQPYANGRLDPHVQLFGVDPAQVMAWALRNSRAPSWILVGQVDFTRPIDVSFDEFTPWRAMEEIALRVSERESVPTYLQFLRNASASYDVQLVLDPAPGEDVVTVTFGDNELRLTEQTTHEKFATRVYVYSGGDPGVELSIADHGFIIESITTTLVANDTVVFRAEDDPFGEDDQLNTKYLEMPDGTTRILVNDTIAATRRVVLASAVQATVGEIVRFVEDAAGTDLEALDSPAGQVAPHGEITLILKREDIPPINNLLPENGYLNLWTGGTPDGYSLIDNSGSATIAQDTSDLFSRFGLSSASVFGNEGDIFQYDKFKVNLRDDRRMLTAMTMLWVLSGAVRLELVNETDPNDIQVWYPDLANVKARSPMTSFWTSIAVFPFYDFWSQAQGMAVPQTFSEVLIRLVIEEDNTTFKADAFQLLMSAVPADTYFDGSAANHLWWVARDYLKFFGIPQKFYTVGFFDKDRTGFVTGEEVVPGSMAELTDAAIGIPTTQKRIMQASWDHLLPGKTEIEVERIPAEFADRFLGKPRAPVRVVEDERQKPSCPIILLARLQHGDLEVQWTRAPGIARTQIRKPGPGTTNREKWNNGAIVFEGGDVTSWVLKEGDRTTVFNQPQLQASDIDQIMLEVYSATGNPGDCIDSIGVIDTTIAAGGFPCPNIGPADGTGVQCTPSPQAGDPYDIHTYIDILASDFPLLGITPGVTKVSLCADVSTSVGGCIAVNAAGTLCLLTDGFIYEQDWEDPTATLDPSKFNFTGGVSINNNRLEITGQNQYLQYIQKGGFPSCVSEAVIALLVSTSPEVAAVVCPENDLDSGHHMVSRSFISTFTHWNYGRIDDGIWSLYTSNQVYGLNLCERWNGISVAPEGGTNRVYQAAGDHGCGRTVIRPDWIFNTTDSTYFGLDFVPGVASSTLGETGTSAVYYSNGHLSNKITVDNLVNQKIRVRRLAGDTWLQAAVIVSTPQTGLGTLDLQAPNDGAGGWWDVLEILNGTTDAVEHTFLGSEMPTGKVWAGSHIDLGGPFVTADLWGQVKFEQLTAAGGPISATTGRGQTGDINTFKNIQIVGGQPIGLNTGILRITAQKAGADTGDACVRNLQMNVGLGCCTFTPPQIGLPPINPNCLITASMVVNSVATCAAGTGVSVTANWIVDQSDPSLPCDDNQNAMDVWWFEERDPAGSPGNFTLVRKDTNVALPSAQTYTTTITDECISCSGGSPSDPDPPLTNPRGSDASGPVVKQWRARVVMYHKFQRSQQGHIDTVPVDSPVAYNDC